ncbi:MAG: ketoacyl-ACP synthase III, partial [Lentisphaerae bacterium]|nr:ketoacyl-ACP synthase III [Lentisphaerota bacterium]
MTERTVAIAGVGSYLPKRVLTNAELESMVDTSDEWIRTRTGIRERHIAAEHEATSDMAAEAARRALDHAGVSPGDVQLLIVATVTPDMFFPSTACFVQEQIGATEAFCFDLEAACSGFLYGIKVGKRFVASGLLDTVLVIGAEKLSCVTDWNDRATCVLFGDGAGAAVLRPRENGGGIMSSFMGSDGRLADLLNIPGGGSRRPASAATLSERLHYMKMNGREVFKHAVRCMCDAGQRVLDRCGLTIEDIDCVIPHQANMRIIRAIADRLGTSLDRFYVNLDRVGNMSAASVPVALDEAVRNGRVKRGDKILFIVFGGGFTWG